MSYLRVIPRDLFNEANLLKCLGRLWIMLDDRRDLFAKLGDAEGEHDGSPFEIIQDENDGSLYCANVPFRIRRTEYTLFRPLNSRAERPLYIHYNFDDIAVFDEHGNLSREFLKVVS